MTKALLDARGRTGRFWTLAVLVAALGAALMSHDLDRPFYGLHSVDRAHNAWLARSHVVYGLGYTHGFPTFEVGHPPSSPPERYLDHPIGYVLVNAATMAILGVHTWSLRVTNIVFTALALLVFMRIVRGLRGPTVALVAGFVLAQLPLVTYFGLDQLLYPLVLGAVWCYLVRVRALADGPEPSRRHTAGLALGLFAATQIRWQGAFFAAAIGADYLLRCTRHRERPRASMLGSIAGASALGIALDFVVLAAGDGWNFVRLAALFGWRAGSGEREAHAWGPWLLRVGEFAVTNFTWVVLGLVAAWALAALTGRAVPGRSEALDAFARYRFPEPVLFVVPGVLQLVVLKGVVWEHQWWERPFAPVVAIAAALGTLALGDAAGRASDAAKRVVVGVVLVAISVSCYFGTRHYFDLRYYYEERIALFDALRHEIPPDRALLSFESYRFDQNPEVKQGSYRPEVAWHLDRDIVVARRLEAIVERARSGDYPFYLMPMSHRREDIDGYLKWLGRELGNRYPSRVVRGTPDQRVFDFRPSPTGPR